MPPLIICQPKSLSISMILYSFLLGSHWILGGHCIHLSYWGVTKSWRESLYSKTHWPGESVIPRIQWPGESVIPRIQWPGVNPRAEWLGGHSIGGHWNLQQGENLQYYSWPPHCYSWVRSGHLLWHDDSNARCSPRSHDRLLDHWETVSHWPQHK